MIEGRVNDSLDPVISLFVPDTDGELREIEAFLDTGFNGMLSMPGKMIEDFEFPWRTCSEAVLADGSVIMCDVHAGRIRWDCAERAVDVERAETAPLVGMRLMEGYDLNIEVRRGGPVRLARH